MDFEKGRTIAAIATPPGEGGIAVIRISGKNAFTVANALFSKNIDDFPSHTAHFGQILDKQEKILDDVLLLILRGSRSYTGEDTVEISCHGGPLISKKVLAAAYDAGAKPARPGEFTYKAFINGKIDLSQAEAVQELISAKNSHAMQAAHNQLQGRLSKKISTLQDQLTHCAAIIEAWVDFPEEDLEFTTTTEMINSLKAIFLRLESLRNSFDDGKRLSIGISLCLLGAPNVGKSSIMNLLLGSDRAIVTDIAGTTRDLLEEELSIGGLHFKLIDTAGIRTSDEIIEREGIRRSKQAASEADIILFVCDSSQGISEEEERLLSSLPKEKTLLIWNKIDLPHSPLRKLPFTTLILSVISEEGLTPLKHTIESFVWEKGPPPRDELLITKQRHYEALKQANHYLTHAIEGLQSSLSPEFICSDLRLSLAQLSLILGRDISEDLLDKIFSTFCIGK